MSTTATITPLSLHQKLFLSIGVPLVLLGLFEIACRGIEWFARPLSSKPTEKPLLLEMPTWMLQDSNAISKIPQIAGSAETVDWLRLFTAGDGYRVHLLPNLNTSVTNTFSLIPADRAQKYSIRSNSWGFRGDEVVLPKPQNTFRVAVFGDSSSFGWGVNQDESFSALLPERLPVMSDGRKVEVVNFAIPGDSSAYGRLVFDRFAPRIQADLFILGFGANDAKTVLTSHTAQVERFRRNASKLSVLTVLQNSALVRTLTSLIQTKPDVRSKEKRVPRIHAVALPEFASNLENMSTTAAKLASHGALVLSLCTPPSYSKMARATARATGARYFNGQQYLVRRLQEIEAGKHYPELVAEMRSSYPRELDQKRIFYVTSDGCHPNKLGHRMITDEIARIIVTPPELLRREAALKPRKPRSQQDVQRSLKEIRGRSSQGLGHS
jgi:lysophospholipase L1-like esterase